MPSRPTAGGVAGGVCPAAGEPGVLELFGVPAPGQARRRACRGADVAAGAGRAGTEDGDGWTCSGAGVPCPAGWKMTPTRLADAVPEVLAGCRHGAGAQGHGTHDGATDDCQPTLPAAALGEARDPGRQRFIGGILRGRDRGQRRRRGCGRRRLGPAAPAAPAASSAARSARGAGAASGTTARSCSSALRSSAADSRPESLSIAWMLPSCWGSRVPVMMLRGPFRLRVRAGH